MSQDPNDLQSQKEGKPDKNLNTDSGEERFQSDTQKIVRRHLENEEDEITHEDIANVRVGMNPPDLDAPTEARFKGDDAKEEAEKEILGDRVIEEDENVKDDKLTPWDTIDPK